MNLFWERELAYDEVGVRGLRFWLRTTQVGAGRLRCMMQPRQKDGNRCCLLEFMSLIL